MNKSKLNIKFPIIQAPMAGGITTPELVAAVSNAGCLGSLGAAYMQPEEIRMAIKMIRQLTDKPFSVNLFIQDTYYNTEQQLISMLEILKPISERLSVNLEIPKQPFLPLFDEQIKVVIEEKVPVFSFTFGVLDGIFVKELHKNKTIIIGTITNVDEAEILANDNIDILVAQGSEAGGHRGTFYGDPIDHGMIGIMSLISQVVNSVNVPIVAAGGIMDARGINAALSLGAKAVQMGTAFLCCQESGANKLYKECLLNVNSDTTVITKDFTGKFARCIFNEFIKYMKKYQLNILDFPIQHCLTKQIRKAAEQQNEWEYMALYAGQSAHLCTKLTAAKLIQKIIKELHDDITKNHVDDKRLKGEGF